MGFSIFGRIGALAIPVGIVFAVGCSSTPPAPRAYVSATLTSTGGTCTGVGGTQTILQIGTFGISAPDRAIDGGPIHITCTVSGSEPNFRIQLSARSDSTVMGGSISITGGNISNASGGTGLSATFVGVGYGAYEGTNCTLDYSYNGTPLQTTNPNIAPGRVWAHLSCPGATNNSTTTGGGQVSTCNAAADFVFEDCGS